MFKAILAPVDLAHLGSLQRALDCAADLARHYNASITYVGVTSSGPSSIARNPEEFSRILKSFVQAEVERHGIEAKAHVSITNDPTTEVDDALLRAIDELETDLVVMGSHIPGATEYIWPSNGGKIAGHAKCSGLVVRQ